MRVLTVLLVAGLVAVTAVSAAADGGGAARRRLEAREVAIYNRAIEQVRAAHPGCRKLVGTKRRSLTGAPDPALLAALGVLRRPQTDADRKLGPHMPFPGGGSVFTNYVRLARQVDGADLFVVPVADTRAYPHPPAYCLTLDRHQIDRDLAPLPARRRRDYARHLHHLLGFQVHQLHHKPRPGVWLISQGAGGGGGAPYTAAQIQRGGPLGGFWSPGHPVFTFGLLPDGVASITAHYPARSATVVEPTRPGPRGLHRHRVHAPALTVNEPVLDNVVAFRVNRPGELGGPTTVEWHDAAGAVIRTVRERG